VLACAVHEALHAVAHLGVHSSAGASFAQRRSHFASQ
jgi:hypothetical protein